MWSPVDDDSRQDAILALSANDVVAALVTSFGSRDSAIFANTLQSYFRALHATAAEESEPFIFIHRRGCVNCNNLYDSSDSAWVCCLTYTGHFVTETRRSQALSFPSLLWSVIVWTLLLAALNLQLLCASLAVSQALYTYLFLDFFSIHKHHARRSSARNVECIP